MIRFIVSAERDGQQLFDQEICGDVQAACNIVESLLCIASAGESFALTIETREEEYL